MDKRAPVKDVSSELARELLIAIPHTAPERELLIEISHNKPEKSVNSKSVHKYSNGYKNGYKRTLDSQDSVEKLREGLISISNAPAILQQ